jgi:hypothetical protein
MAALHKGHGGITKMRKLAQDLYFWPGIANDIKMMVDGCRSARRGARASRERRTRVRAAGLGLGGDRHGPVRVRGKDSCWSPTS